MWVKINCGALTHPKLLSAGPAAVCLWLAGLCYANLHATDGAIPEGVLPALYPSDEWSKADRRRAVEKLVSVGLWVKSDTGWTIHGYAEYQAEALRQSQDERRRRDRERKAAQRGALKSAETSRKPKEKSQVSAEKVIGTRGKTTQNPSENPNLEPNGSAGLGDVSRRDTPGTCPTPVRAESTLSDPIRTDPDRQERREGDPPPPAVEGGVDGARCGTVEVGRPTDPAMPTADAVLDLLARKSGGNLDARGTIDTLKHFKRAVDELRYPMLAWEHLAAQTALDPTRLWSSTYLLGRLNGQGGRVTLQLLLGRRLPDADPTRCAYDCAPLQEAINSARREALAREARTNG